MNLSGLHRKTKANVLSANRDFKNLTGVDIPIIETRASIRRQAEIYTDYINEDSEEITSVLPGCSYLNYGIGITVDITSTHVIFLVNPTFNELMRNHHLLPINDNDRGTYYNSETPHMTIVQNAIRELLTANSGHSWRWENTVRELKSVLERYDEIAARIYSIQDELNDLDESWNEWYRRRDLLIAVLNINLNIFNQRLVLLLQFREINNYISELETQYNELMEYQNTLDEWIIYHDNDVERYNAAVRIYNDQINQWENDYLYWYEGFVQIVAWKEDCESNPGTCSEEEIDELNAQILYYNTLFDHLEARRVELDNEYTRLENWHNEILQRADEIERQVMELTGQIEQNRINMAQAESAKNEVENALASLPDLTEIQENEFNWLIAEEERLTQIEWNLNNQLNEAQQQINELDRQINELSNAENELLELIIEFVDNINYTIVTNELLNSASHVFDEIEEAERAEMIKDKLEGLLPEQPDLPDISFLFGKGEQELEILDKYGSISTAQDANSTRFPLINTADSQRQMKVIQKIFGHNPRSSWFKMNYLIKANQKPISLNQSKCNISISKALKKPSELSCVYRLWKKNELVTLPNEDTRITVGKNITHTLEEYKEKRICFQELKSNKK